MATIKSIEEKAKAYDKAIKRVEDIEAGKCQKPFVFTEGLFDYIFPELKESEDEKIMKALYKMAKVPRKEIYEAEGITKEQALAWLEKQCEQKETLCDKCKKTQPSHSCQDITALGRCALEKQGEQELTEFEKAVKQVMEEAIECGDTHNLKADAEMLLSLVHKSAWSEDDEERIKNILSVLDAQMCWDGATGKKENPYQKEIDWLKSLKPQNTWKPSDEQLKTLDEIIDVLHSMQMFGGSSALIFLKHDLMKLREE